MGKKHQPRFSSPASGQAPFCFLDIPLLEVYLVSSYHRKLKKEQNELSLELW